MGLVKVLFLGDVVGSSGRKVIAQHLPNIRTEKNIDFVVANAENAAHGNGLTPPTAEELFRVQIDCLTGGNHTFDKKEIYDCFTRNPDRILRPANYADGTAGVGSTLLLGRNGHKIGVINLMGRVFMEPIDCPFQVFDREFEKLKAQTNIILVDMHAEATSEKNAMGHYADGRASAVVGSHSHIPTADERILPKGTGYLTDCGMNGPYDSIIGVKTEIILQRFTKKQHLKMEVAEGPGTLWGVIFTIDSVSGKCVEIERVRRES